MRKSLKISLSLGLLIVLIGTGLIVYEDWFGFGGIQSGDAIAPTFEPAITEQVIYRIDTTQSTVTYAVDETFAGRDISTAIGTTQQIAGDILIDIANPAQSQIGTIVINIEQFESDSNLRDRRIRQEFLESELYPEAVFMPIQLIDFPEEIEQGVSYGFQMIGDVTIKEITQSETWDVTVTLDGDSLRGSATTIILMSTYDIGPIDIAGLVETANDVLLTFDFVANAVNDE